MSDFRKKKRFIKSGPRKRYDLVGKGNKVLYSVTFIVVLPSRVSSGAL